MYKKNTYFLKESTEKVFYAFKMKIVFNKTLNYTFQIYKKAL